MYLVRKCFIAFLVATSIFSVPKVFAQEDYLYENISVADGLSSSRFNILNTIYQDKFGFLWLGTVDGLNRYDGYNFKVYKNIPGDTTSLPSSNILNINEDADGNLWIATPGMMSILDRKNNTFSNYPIDNGDVPIQQGVNIFRSLVDSKGNFWIGTQGRSAQKWDKEKKQWNIVPFLLQVEGVDSLVKSQVSGVACLTELKNGNLLAADFTNGIFYYNENSNTFESFRFAGNSQPQGIIEIFEDRGGKVWISGRNTFLEYNPITFNLEEKDDWKRFKTTADQNFLFGINQLEDGSLFMCSLPIGLLKYNPSTEKFEQVKIGGELGQRGVGAFPQTKFVDKFGVYWIGLGDNGILKFDPKRRPFRYYQIDKENVNQSDRAITTGIRMDPTNPKELIVSTNKKGFLKYNLNDKSIKQMNVQIPAIYSDSSNLRNFVNDDDNKIWFSSSPLNISSYNLRSGKTATFRVIKKRMTTGGGENIYRLEYLPSDQIIVSSNVGPFVFNTKTKKVEPLPTITNRKYSKKLIDNVKKVISESNPIAAFTKVGEAANLSKKISIKKETEVLAVCVGEGNYPNGIFDFGMIQDNDGNKIWGMDTLKTTFYDGGGYKNRIKIGVVKLKPGDYNVIYTTDVGHSYPEFNVVAPENPTWYGIQLIELDSGTAESFKNQIAAEENNKSYMDIFTIQSILSSRKYPNNLWLGANERGIVKYNMVTGNFEQYLLKDIESSQVSTRGIFEDSKGILWITVSPSGFYRFNPETEEFTSNANIPDLPLTGINGIVEDFQGSLWISSSGGITKLSQNKVDGAWTTSSYDSKDGVPGGFGSGALITRDGEIYFGSFNGLTAFYPGTENTSPPIPMITNMTVSDISIFDKDSDLSLDKSIFDEDQIDLSYAQNDVSFEFASLHFSRPSKNRVSYKLDGFNDHWIFTDKNFASFTNLDPGEYTLSVKAFSGFGVPSKDERTLKIIVAPPWYRTTVAYITYGFLFVAFVFGLDRFQRHRLLTKERERQKIQEAELRAIAAEAQAKVAEADNERKTKELEEARQLQLSMLPKKVPQIPNLDIAVYMKTATEVGGDYYDFHVSMDGTLTVVVGDATGHGMRAGTMVTAAKSLFSTHAANPDILFTFSEISRCIKHMDMHLLTMCMTVLKINQNRMIMSAAGMPPTLIYRNSTKQLEEITIKGMPLGAVDKFPYSIRETELVAGDTLLLMSDGFPELFNEKKELFGYERVQTEFHKVADKSPEQIIDRLKSSASDWAGDSDPNDDVTFVVIKVK